MNKKILILILILFFISKWALSESIHCPDLPLKIKIGETTNQGWHAWFSDEERSYFNKIYYSYNDVKLYIPDWDGHVWGTNEAGISRVGCCYSDKSKGVKEVCVTKIVGRMVCEAKTTPSRDETYFSCISEKEHLAIEKKKKQEAAEKKAKEIAQSDKIYCPELPVKIKAGQPIGEWSTSYGDFWTRVDKIEKGNKSYIVDEWNNYNVGGTCQWWGGCELSCCHLISKDKSICAYKKLDYKRCKYYFSEGKRKGRYCYPAKHNAN